MSSSYAFFPCMIDFFFLDRGRLSSSCYVAVLLVLVPDGTFNLMSVTNSAV